MDFIRSGGWDRAYCALCLLAGMSSIFLHQDSALQSILLHLDITVDEKENVSVHAGYTPTFTWRYKQENLMHYRVIASNGSVPDGMSSDQQKKMTASEASVAKILKNAAADMVSE